MENTEATNQPDLSKQLLQGFLDDGPNQYIDDLFEQYSETDESTVLKFLSEQLRFKDRDLGIDLDNRISDTFYLGTLIGLKMVNNLHPQPEFRKSVMTKIKFILEKVFDDTLHIPDDFDASVTIVERLLACSEAGCERFSDLSSIIEDVEDRVIANATESPYLRKGMGFVLFAMIMVEQDQAKLDSLNSDLAKFESEIQQIESGEATLDWDSLTKH